MIILGNDIGRQFTGVVAYDTIEKKIILNETLNLPLHKMRKDCEFNPTAYRLAEIEKWYVLLVARLQAYDEYILSVVEDYAFGADNILAILKAKNKTYADKILEMQTILKRNDRDPLSLAEVHGIIYSTMSFHNIPIIKVVPSQLKRFVTGNGAADKPEVMKVLKDKYNAVLDDHHQYDALGLCHMGRYFVAYCRKPASIPEGYSREVMSGIAHNERYRLVYVKLRNLYRLTSES